MIKFLISKKLNKMDSSPAIVWDVNAPPMWSQKSERKKSEEEKVIFYRFWNFIQNVPGGAFQIRLRSQFLNLKCFENFSSCWTDHMIFSRKLITGFEMSPNRNRIFVSIMSCLHTGSPLFMMKFLLLWPFLPQLLIESLQFLSYNTVVKWTWDPHWLFLSEEVA